MKNVLLLLTFLLPWPLRRLALQVFFGYSIHPTSRIGFAWVLPRRLILEAHSRIGHLTVCKGMDLVQLGPHAIIGRLNWITAFPSSSKQFFRDEVGRMPMLVLGAHAAITGRHLVDCTASVTVGDFATVAGWRSQILTHSIDIESSQQSCRPIEIGRYCFVGTDCVILGGSRLPDFSVLGAKSLLNKTYTETHYLYAGTPSRPLKRLDERVPYFLREVGVVN
jgi:acetyltransferase-like isoleucine patch superfamily enzyme